MTAGDRLIGLAFVTAVLLLAGGYGFVLRHKRRPRPWLLLAGTAVLGAGLLIPFLPLALLGCLVIGADVLAHHQAVAARSGRHRR